ncbi:MAG: group II intron reverse transcriptase/maturase [Calothrix sp. MO_167.B12]|nr:group II intron reverse transcriptase/maturase [Calothrix sp. MO_167.B12]
MSELKTTYKWNKIPWRKLERKLFKLQKRIYQASQRGNVKKVHRLQRLVMNSWSAKCVAVRRISQDNQGKKTAGVDGIKCLSPEARLNLVKALKLGHKSTPTRRVWIPKPGTEEKRALGIPTIHDRATQTLAKLALEPEWEAKFEPHSYGFRPGRSCHDAVKAIFGEIRKPKYALDADISKCFDSINHKVLLEKLNTTPTIRKQIKAWLESAVMDGKQLFPTQEGTPQGGCISPLLANVALHGMETFIENTFPTKYYRINGSARKTPPPTLIRYADDFVILHPDIEVIKGCQIAINQWLNNLGLRLKPSKTKITHTLENYQGNVGFDFLGYNIRQYDCGKNRGIKDTRGNKLDFIPLTKPSDEAVKRHLRRLGEIIDAHVSAPQQALIAKLNPIIMGWARYFFPGASKETFTKVDHLLHKKLRSWANKRHPNKNLHWISKKYWLIDTEGWIFATKDKKFQLWKHAKMPIKRHTIVQSNRSPYDGDWVYWGTRMGKHPELTTAKAKLLKRQNGKCNRCGLNFKQEDLIEIDHIIPRHKGGKDRYENYQLLHRHCHHEKTAEDNSAPIAEAK